MPADLFDPNSEALIKDHIFGLPHHIEEADLVIIPVPWEVTATFGLGTAKAPLQVLNASLQVDLFNLNHPESWQFKLAMDIIDANIERRNMEMRLLVEQANEEPLPQQELQAVNEECARMVGQIKERAHNYLNKGKIAAVLGGDHSTCLGLIQALAHRYRSFSILQIDAHADLRVQYQGFEFSHASIMHNALKLAEVNKLVQVGVRDLCEEEATRIRKDERISTFYDQYIKENAFRGGTWEEKCDEIINELSDNVYISFDVDGLNPSLCPHTGTPVPGGLGFDEAVFLLKQIGATGKNIIGFDICETGNSLWDANVTARLIYTISCEILAHKKAPPIPKAPSQRMDRTGQPVKPH